MILFHGSNTEVTSIDLQKSKPNKDFGRAFYLSDNEQQAFEMAEFKTSTLGGNIIINKFSLRSIFLKINFCNRFFRKFNSIRI